MGLIGGLARTPILSGEAYRGPRSVYPEESLDKLSAHRERAEPGLGRTGKYAPYAVVLPPFYWVVGGVSYLLPALFPLASHLCLKRIVTVMTLEDQEISLVESD